MKGSSRVAAVVSVLVCASCGLPSQPESLPVGIAQVNGTVVGLIPACPDAAVESVVVAPVDDASPIDESQWWSASGYVAPGPSSVSERGVPLLLLEASQWETSAGPALDWTKPFSVDVWADGQRFGAVLDTKDVSRLGALEAKYLVEGEVMTEQELFDDYGPTECPTANPLEQSREPD